MESKDVKIIRLSTGEDIICGLIENGDRYFLQDPMIFIIKDTGKQFILMLQNWLPLQVMKENNTIINASHVITIMEPDENFIEYYIEYIKDMKENKKAKEDLANMEDINMNVILEQMDISEGQTIH
jgi:hypothetical protein